MQPLIIEAAINGMTTKAINPAVPRSNDEIVAAVHPEVVTYPR